MAGFNLSNLSDRISQVLTDNVNISSLFGKNDKAILDFFSSLSNGETIIGKVLSSTEDSFQITTLDNIIINAKAEAGVKLAEGTSVLFEVNKFSEGKVSLRPLYQNTSSEETAKSALRQAGIIANERALETAVRNMEYGNPIDRNSLLNSYKDVLQFDNYPVKYIVDLQKMNIPVTEANLGQYSAYMNMRNMLADSFMDISESLLNDLSRELSEGFEAGSKSISDFINNDSIMNAKGIIDSVLQYSETDRDSGEFNLLHEFDVVKIKNELDSFGFSSDNIASLLENDSENNMPGNHSFNAKEVLNHLFKDINDSVNRQISDVISDKDNPVSLQVNKLLSSDELKGVLYKSLLTDWADEPKGKDESDKKSIGSLYKRLFDNTRVLSDTLSIGLKNTPTSELINNLRNNIEFMDQLNKYIPYVQIPINTNPGNKAELYVYRNKKNLAASDGEMSALLHLDMEHIGRTDVLIKLNDNKVTTNFKLADEEALNLIEKHLPLLDKRLTEKGYYFKHELQVMDKLAPPIQQILESNEDHLIIAKTSFDARI